MTVSSSTNRVSYAGNGSTTVFPYTYKIFDQDDLTVILRAANGTETVQTITSQYTVSGVGNAGGGNVTMLTAPATGTTLVILREQDLIQELDIVPNDPFPSESLEGALDRLTFMVQQHEETLGRTIKASRTNTIAGSEFTISAADRANKVFAFDGSGDVSITQGIGIYRGNWSASVAYNVRDIVKDTSTNNIFIANTAHTSSGSQPITTNTDSAKWDLLVDAASATTSANNAANSASAAEADRILAQSAKTDAEAAQTAAELAETNAETAETNAEAAQTAAEAAQTAAELAYDNFDDRYLGAKATDPTLDNDGDALIDGALYFDTANNVMKVYDLGTTTWLRTTPTSGDQANINTVSGIAANVTTVAGISADVTAVAAVDTDVTAVAAITSDVTAVAANATNINTVAGIDANVTTVAGISANVTTVAGISADVTTVANNVADITNFSDVYLGPKTSDPATRNDTSALQAGDLYFNTVSDQMFVYDGAAWLSTNYVSSNVDINGGTIDGTVIGGSTPAAITGTTGQFGTSLNVDGTVTADSLIVANNAPATYITSFVENSASDGFVQAQFNVGASGANGVAQIGYIPGTFFALGPVSNDTTTPIIFRNNNAAERMRIDASGNVGIGTSSPSSKLHLSGAATADARITLTQTTAGLTSTLQQGATGLALSAAGSQVLLFDTNGAERMRITSTGNVGIGTSSPAQALDIATGAVSSQIRISGTASPNANNTIYGDKDGLLILSADTTNVASGSQIRFNVDGTERMRIDASGSLMVGASSAGEDGISLRPRLADLTSQITFNRTNTAASGIVLSFRNNGTVVGSVSHTNTATAYNTSSDYRLKEDVQPMVGSVDRLMALNPVNFAWKVDGTRVDGFLAHEAQEVVPEAVTGTKDAVDKDGKPVHQGIDQSKLVPLLTAALQEALTKIEALEARITALEA